MATASLDGMPYDMPLVVPRETWDAVEPNFKVKLKLPVKYVVFHHLPSGNGVCRNFDTCAKTILKMQTHHMGHFEMRDIAYNFLISGDAMAWEGRGWEVESEPLLKYPQYNGDRIDIAFVGLERERLRFVILYDKAMQLINFGIKFKLIKDNFVLIDKDPSSERKSTGFGKANETAMDFGKKFMRDHPEEKSPWQGKEQTMDMDFNRYRKTFTEIGKENMADDYSGRREDLVKEEDDEDLVTETDQVNQITNEEEEYKRIRTPEDLMGMNQANSTEVDEEEKRRMREDFLMKMDQMNLDEMDDYTETVVENEPVEEQEIAVEDDLLLSGKDENKS